jgi:hypothetical protein
MKPQFKGWKLVEVCHQRGSEVTSFLWGGSSSVGDWNLSSLRRHLKTTRKIFR